VTAAREKPSPIEVWLRQRNLSVSCKVVYGGESTEELEIDLLSMRGAQREITGWLISQGYMPDGRWAAEAGVDDETWAKVQARLTQRLSARSSSQGVAQLECRKCDEQVNSVALPGAGASASVALRRPARSYAPGQYDPGRRGDPHMKQPSGDDPRAVGN